MKEYTVKTSLDGSNWSSESEIFSANFDQNTKVRNVLQDPVEARYVKMFIKKWNKRISMRAAIIVARDECFKPSSSTSLNIHVKKKTK